MNGSNNTDRPLALFIECASISYPQFFTMNIVLYCISISIFLHLRKKMIQPVFIYMRFDREHADAGWGLPVSIILYPTTLFLILII